MPIYEYRCAQCGKVFQTWAQQAERGAAPQCPACGEEQTERVPSRVAAQTRPGGCGSKSIGFR